MIGVARRESPALIRSFRRDFSPVRRPIDPTVEIFFVRRATGGGPLHRIAAARTCVADTRREPVSRFSSHMKKCLCPSTFFNPAKIAP
jgi:hypothetical protein